MQTLRAIAIIAAITVAGVLLTILITSKTGGTQNGKCFDGAAQQLDCAP